MSAATALNSLPPHIRDAPSLPAFRRELKTELFRLIDSQTLFAHYILQYCTFKLHQLFIADLRDI